MRVAWFLALFALAACGSPDGGGAECGNGEIDPFEACDGANLNGLGCQDLDFSGGTLVCNVECQFDTSGCQGPCGDGRLDPGEDCDGEDLGGKTCRDLGHFGGTLACAPDCSWDQSRCQAEDLCGNGQIDQGEECDGADLGGQTCGDLGNPGGELSCTAGCRFDLSGCGCQEDAFEPNDQSGSPAAIEIDFSGAALTLCGEDDPDWYQLELEADRPYGFHLAFAHAAGDINVELYPAAQLDTPVAAGLSGDDDEQFRYTPPAATAGLHLIRVWLGSPGIEAQFYDMTVTREALPECQVDGDCPDGQICRQQACVDPAPGDRCDDPVVVDGFPYGVTGVDIAAFGPRLELDSNACTSYGTAGRDVVYRLQLGAGRLFEATLTPTFDGSLYLVADCSVVPIPSAGCLAGADAAGPGGTETLQYTAPEAGTFYLVVDHYAEGGPASGSYDLSLTLQ